MMRDLQYINGNENMVFDEYGKKNQQYEEKTAGVD